MDTLENSLAGWIGSTREYDKDLGQCARDTSSASKKSETPATSSSRKRTSSVAFGKGNTQLTIDGEQRCASVPFSATEAQDLIQQEFIHGRRLNKKKRAALESAIVSLNESLSPSLHKNEHLSLSQTSTEPLEELSLPSIDLIQLILQRKNPSPFV
jgi:hypothetical protein